MNLLYMFLIIFYVKRKFSFVSAEGLPRQSDKNDKKIIFAHMKQQLELRCPIEKFENERTRVFVDWHKGNLSLYGENGYTITKKGDLKIKNVKKEDDGIFTCEGINGYGFIRVNITVVVYDPEIENKNDTGGFLYHNSINRASGNPPIIKKHPSARTVDIGGSVTFHCIASGSPPPKIFFFKDENLIPNNENEISNGNSQATIRLRNLGKANGGTYKCIARNNLGEDEVDFELHITDPSYPPAITSLEPSSVTVKEGQVAAFWCEIKSKPDIRLHIKWLKQLNRKEIEQYLKKSDASSSLLRFNHNYYRLLNSSEKIGEYISRFSISNVVKEDSGIYVCLAINDNGYRVKNATLTVIRTALQMKQSSTYFPVRNEYFIAAIAIPVAVVLIVTTILTHCCCRKSRKNIPPSEAIRKTECENLNPSPIAIKDIGKVDKLSYPDIEDYHSNARLLCGNKSYSCDHRQYHISRSLPIPKP